MPKRELKREIALATGESVATTDELGFVPLTYSPFECEPLTVDWEELTDERVALFAAG